jgi:membrane protein implicated in regulation of membrane protease activity
MSAPRHPLVKYLTLQLPGWAFASIVLGLLVYHGDLSLPVAGLLFAVWIAKDFVLFPILRIGYEHGSLDGTDGLIGALGTVRETLDPEGYIRVGSELWRARVPPEQAPVDEGAAVRVLEVRALTLHVEPL